MSNGKKKSKNLKKKISKNLKMLKIFFFAEEKKMLSSYFCHLRRLVFDQSSPVHPVSESRGGSPERYGGRSLNEQTNKRKSSCLI